MSNLWDGLRSGSVATEGPAGRTPENRLEARPVCHRDMECPQS